MKINIFGIGLCCLFGVFVLPFVGWAVILAIPVVAVVYAVCFAKVLHEESADKKARNRLKNEGR